MRDAAASAGVELQIVSAFRGVDYQLGIVRRKLERGLSMHEILRVSAAPGYSEHHSGRALDITAPGFAALEEEFENSSAFAWLSANAQRYGFHLSYPRDNPHGIAYEPWHWCWRATRRTAS
jgi:D-alanyl-D-alanine carboxypeptidase